MDIHNFELNKIFDKYAKEYQSRPVMAMKYRSGAENGWMVYYRSVKTNNRESRMHGGVRFFPNESDAWKFICANEKQYAYENNVLLEMDVIYDKPMPVLYRKDENAENLNGIHFCFGESAFISDESMDYEFFILEDGCWIVRDLDGGIRVWDKTMEELFFGKESKCVCEVVCSEEWCDYIPVEI